MRIVFIVQRYGEDVAGGAEYHCRLVAERLAQQHEVEIVTTCARDYVTWENVYPAGDDCVSGLKVKRFPVVYGRSAEFDFLANEVLYGWPDQNTELNYIRQLGPYSPEMMDYLSTVDAHRFIFFSYRYWTCFQGLRMFGNRAILVPTAEHDPTLYLKSSRQTFQLPRAIGYNSPEERDLIHKITGNQHIPGVVVGTGLDDSPLTTSPAELRNRLDLPADYIVYTGRIELAKGCGKMLDYYLQCFDSIKDLPALVLVGAAKIPIPDHAGIYYLGFLAEEEKMAVIEGARLLLMPSRYESLSMVVLEAWRMKRPVLVNAHCEVLRGQCTRSGGGLYYRNADEFKAAMELLLNRSDIGTTLGNQGYIYYQENYSWDVILEKYQQLLEF